MQILITCPFWCASLLAKELKRLNLPLIESHPTAVLSEWTWKDIYRINLWSRIANKVYAVMWENKITNFDQLFDFVLSLNWNSLFVQTTQFSLHASCKNSQIMSEKSLVSVAHKAILTSLNVLEDTKTDPDKSQEVFLFMSWNTLKVCINTSW
jgi:23S rRNA (guanine2445-N2)-methyltransferase / 23S rRNA (guanine2069-N7)-methyltransferase